MSRTNETKHMQWHATCKCKCRLHAGVCNNKQRWNDDKCRCECKTLIDKGVCDIGPIWNPSNYEWECYKSCDAGEYLDYENRNCRKKFVECSSAEECTENIDEVKIAGENWYVCFYTICVVLAISNGIGAYFVYSRWYLKRDITRVKFSICTQTI